jgi:uncharacterized membrane protein (UPF0127 family)
MKTLTRKQSLYVIGILSAVIVGVFLLFSIKTIPGQKKDIEGVDQGGEFSEYLSYNRGQVIFGSEIIPVFIADTSPLRTQGLSGKKTLPQEYGMLFIFPKEGLYSFWMKDMNFAIDMVWINEEGTVVHIESNVAPETYPNLFTSTESALYVLEVNAGWVGENRVRVGTKFDLNF